MDPILDPVDSLLTDLRGRITRLQSQLADEIAARRPVIAAGLESSVAWVQPGTVGNTGGGNTSDLPQGQMVPGESAIFRTTATKPYHNPYWYLRLLPWYPEFGTCHNFSYRLSFMFPTAADIASCQALEFQLQRRMSNGDIYNMAWQMELKEFKQWRTFDYNAVVDKWKPTPTPIPVDMSILVPGKWIPIVASYQINIDNGTTTHLSLWIADRSYAVGVIRPKSPTDSRAADFDAGFQLDTNSVPVNYQVKVDNIVVTGS